MKFETAHIKNDYYDIIIREATIEDAEELCNTVKEYVEESEFIPYSQGEFIQTIEQEAEFIRSFHSTTNALLLVAVVNNHIVGNISLNVSPRKMLKHTGCIGIGLLRQYREKGIGSALLSAVLKWAKDKSTLETIWLETVASNVVGLKLYKSVGFEEIGRFPGYIKQENSMYLDSITMILKINKITKI